jgi:hypothetical protein
MNDLSTRRVLVLGWILLAIFLPLGMTLEALHALKWPVYLGSPLRRELWTLAHAHGNLLGILCLVHASLAERALSDETTRRTVARSLSVGALAMPIGFFLGGILHSEGDPSLSILLVPLGGIFLLHALLRAALAKNAAKNG